MLDKAERKAAGTLPQLLAQQAALLGKRTALRSKEYGIWQTFSWESCYDHVRKVSLGLLNIGLKRGDHVGIVMNNHPEWVFSQLGVQAAGGITLNLFTTAVPEELASALGRVKAAYVIVQDQEQTDKILAAREKLFFIKKVIYVDPTGMRKYDDPWILSFRELIEKGEAVHAADPVLFNAMLEMGRQRDTALMVLTSGTTGIPKIAMLTHGNIISMASKWIESVPVRPEANWISMSPTAWIVDQMWLGVALAGGTSLNFPEMGETVMADLREIGPDIIISSSRFWEDLASHVRVKVSQSGFLKRKLFEFAVRAGRDILDGEISGNGNTGRKRFLFSLADFMVCRSLRDRIGCGRLRHGFTGGHPISPDVICFFRAVGVNLKQCYGLTEAGGIFQLQPDNEFRVNTVGKPLPGIEVKLSADEEVLVKSEANFAGYYMDFKSTESAFQEGWLRTGDAGYFDDSGSLVILGRKEEIIRNRDGAAFSPDYMETRLKFSPYIKEVVVFGEARPYITAIINIDPGNVGSWAEERLIPYTTYTDLTKQPPVEGLIREEVQKVNSEIPETMKIRKFILLYKLLDADDEELTRTGKVRRRFVYGLYLKLIEAMYGKSDEIKVTGKIRYQDGRTGVLETSVRIIKVIEN